MPTGVLAPSFVRNFATTNRPDEVTADAQRPRDRASPRRRQTLRRPPDLRPRHGARWSQSGFDPETGLIWGRWAGGVARSPGGGAAVAALDRRSLHYVFAGAQNGPVTLPLTGTATYDVDRPHQPDGLPGHVGTLNTATLDANFTNRTVDAGVNLTIGGQTIIASANGMPIYRDQYFSAYRGIVPPGPAGAAAPQHHLPAHVRERGGIGRRLLRRPHRPGGGDDVQPQRRDRRDRLPPAGRLSDRSTGAPKANRVLFGWEWGGNGHLRPYLSLLHELADAAGRSASRSATRRRGGSSRRAGPSSSRRCA